MLLRCTLLGIKITGQCSVRNSLCSLKKELSSVISLKVEVIWGTIDTFPSIYTLACNIACNIREIDLACGTTRPIIPYIS